MRQGQSVHSEGIMGPAGDLQKGVQVQSAVTREKPFQRKKKKQFRDIRTVLPFYSYAASSHRASSSSSYSLVTAAEEGA